MAEERDGWLKAVFYYCVINQRALEALEPGFFEALQTRYAGGQRMEGIGLFCAMSGGDLEPLFEELVALAQKHHIEGQGRLFEGGVWDGMDFIDPAAEGDEHPRLALPWLLIQDSPSGRWLREQPFALPDRRDHDPDAAREDPYYPQIDVLSRIGLMDDLRPFRVEHWFPGDMDLELACATYFYSVEGIEDWEEAQHQAYLSQNDVAIEGGLGIKVIEDSSAQPMWSVTACRSLDD